MNNGILDGLANDRGFTVEPWKTMGGVDYEPVQATGSLIGATSTWPAVANTLSTWTEITASSPYDACILDVVIYGGNASVVDSSALFDIGTGGAGTETVLIDGIPIYGRGINPLCIRFPIRLAGGTRVAWRMQSAATSASVSSVPAVGIGFVRDIPDYPSGSSVVAVGTIARASSTYTNISVAAAINQRRQVWATVGDLPAGKVIWLIPMTAISSGGVTTSNGVFDWGWLDQNGLAVNTGVVGPREIFAAEVISFVNASELLDPCIPTIWVPDGYTGGCVVVAADNPTSNLLNKCMCFAVIE